MQLIPIQRSPGPLPLGQRQGALSPGAQLAVQLLISFTKRIIANSSSDLIFLAVMGAANDIGLPKEEAERVLQQMLQYQEANSTWPKGFM